VEKYGAGGNLAAMGEHAADILKMLSFMSGFGPAEPFRSVKEEQ
jgi:hypothetical protein